MRAHLVERLWDSFHVTDAADDTGWDVRPYFDVTGAVLMGAVKAPQAERRRRPDGRAQVDVEIHGLDPQQRAESALVTSVALLDSIDDLRSKAEQLAPDEWRSQYLGRSEFAGLFLEGFEFHDDGLVRVLFDFGDLDLLVLDLHPDGKRDVTIEA